MVTSTESAISTTIYDGKNTKAVSQKKRLIHGGREGCDKARSFALHWDRLTVFSFGVHLYKNLLGAHDFDDFTNVGARLLEESKLLAEEPYARVVVVPLGFKTSQNSLPFEDLELHRLDLVLIIVVERHLADYRLLLSETESLGYEVGTQKREEGEKRKSLLATGSDNVDFDL